MVGGRRAGADDTVNTTAPDLSSSSSSSSSSTTTTTEPPTTTTTHVGFLPESASRRRGAESRRRRVRRGRKLLGGCGEQEGSSGPAGELADEVADAMATGADQVAERLGTEGVDVDAGDVRELDGGDVLCPVVRDPQPGDQATCRVELGGIDVEVDVEFGAEGESR